MSNFTDEDMIFSTSYGPLVSVMSGMIDSANKTCGMKEKIPVMVHQLIAGNEREMIRAFRKLESYNELVHTLIRFLYEDLQDMILEHIDIIRPACHELFKRLVLIRNYLGQVLGNRRHLVNPNLVADQLA